MAVDAAAATGSLRTLGAGGLQAAAGNHAHASAARSVVGGHITDNVSIPGATTKYTSLFGSVAFGSEVQVHAPWSRAGTFKSMRIYIRVAQGNSGTLVVTLRKNGANTALAVTVPISGAAGVYATTADVSIAQGDTVGIKIDNNAGVDSVLNGWSLEFEG